MNRFKKYGLLFFASIYLPILKNLQKYLLKFISKNYRHEGEVIVSELCLDTIHSIFGLFSVRLVNEHDNRWFKLALFTFGNHQNLLN